MTGPEALMMLKQNRATKIARPEWVAILKEIDEDGYEKYIVLDPFNLNYGNTSKDIQVSDAMVDCVMEQLMREIMLHDDWEVIK